MDIVLKNGTVLLEDIAIPEFEATKRQWLAWYKWRERTSGLFKPECKGSRMTALC